VGGSDYDYVDSRIADDSTSWQDACGSNITNWGLSDKFVISITAIATPHGGGSQRTMTLYWRDNDDGSPTWVALTTGELAQGTGDDPGAAGCATVEETQFIQSDNQATFDARGQNEEIELSVVVDPTGAQNSHEYQFILYDETDEAYIDAGSITITMEAPAAPPPSSHTYFKTPTDLIHGKSNEVIQWIWNSGQFNIDSGMRATSANPSMWGWYVISSSSSFFYPSGIGDPPTKWIWVSGSYQGGGI